MKKEGKKENKKEKEDKGEERGKEKNMQIQIEKNTWEENQIQARRFFFSYFCLLFSFLNEKRTLKSPNLQQKV